MLSDGFTFTHGQPLRISPNIQSGLQTMQSDLLLTPDTSLTPVTSLTSSTSAASQNSAGKWPLGEMPINENLALDIWSQNYLENYVSLLAG